MSGREWTDEIPGTRLQKALGSDPRSEVGRKLDDVVVTRRDASGRAELITIEGERRKQVRGWEFKMIVGRASRVVVECLEEFAIRSEPARIELCFSRKRLRSRTRVVSARHARDVASRVAYRQILEHYFPGTVEKRAGEGATGRGDKSGTGRQGEWRSAYELRATTFSTVSSKEMSDRGQQVTLKSENFRISYPASIERIEIESVLRTLEAAHRDISRRLIAASMNLPAPALALDVVIHGATQSFTSATGQSWFAAGATRGHRIELQPLTVLRRRRILTSTLRHEYAHAVIEAIGEVHTPRWLAEGLAIQFAGEGATLTRFESKHRLPLDELERKLERPRSAAEMRSLYAAAHREVLALIQKEGESSVWRRVAASNRNALATRSPRLPSSATWGMREQTIR